MHNDAYKEFIAAYDSIVISLWCMGLIVSLLWWERERKIASVWLTEGRGKSAKECQRLINYKDNLQICCQSLWCGKEPA